MAQREEGTQRLATGAGEPGGNPSQASRPDSPGGNGCRGLRQGVASDAEEGASDSLAYHMSSRKFEEGMLSTFDLHTAAQTLLESRIKELQMQMLLIIKQRLVAYYQGEKF